VPCRALRLLQEMATPKPMRSWLKESYGRLVVTFVRRIWYLLRHDPERSPCLRPVKDRGFHNLVVVKTLGISPPFVRRALWKVGKSRYISPVIPTFGLLVVALFHLPL
jgi:hypothetical protein